MTKKKTTKHYWSCNAFIGFIFICVFLSVPQESEAINCYKCNSRNHTNPDCHDPYNPTPSQYKLECLVPKQGHIGLFPAHFCLKITGRKETTGETLMIRECAMETMDNQCGVFRFEDDDFKGCILTCDYDGCNSGFHLNSSLLLTILWPIIEIVLHL